MASPLQDYLNKRRAMPSAFNNADAYNAALAKLEAEYNEAMVMWKSAPPELTGVQYSINTSGGLSARIPSHLNNQSLPIDFSQLLGECEIVKVVIQYRHADGKEYVITQHNAL